MVRPAERARLIEVYERELFEKLLRLETEVVHLEQMHEYELAERYGDWLADGCDDGDAVPT